MQNNDEDYEMDEEFMKMILRQLYAQHASIEKWQGGETKIDVDKWVEHIKENDNYDVATFGAGCFWGTEKYYAKDYA